MPTPITLAEMFDMPRRKITLGGELYAINDQLGLKPWEPPCVEVWVGAEPPNLSSDHRKLWWKLRELLNQLHAEHLRRKKNDQ